MNTKSVKSRRPEFYKPWNNVSFLFFCLLSFVFLSCGEEQTDPTTTDAHIVQIFHFTFIPSEFEARAGDTVFFQNFDETPHLILSESAPDFFDDTGVFSSVFIDSDGVGTITIPAGTVVGTQLFFYSDALQEMMATPNGTITIIN